MKNINRQTSLKNSAALYNKEELSTHFNLGYRYKLHEINKISEKMGFANTGNLFVRLGHIGHSIDNDIIKAVKYMNSPATISENNSSNIRANRIYDGFNQRKNKFSNEGNTDDSMKEQKSNFVIKTKILGDNFNIDHTTRKASRYNNNIHLVSEASDKLTENIRSPLRFLNGSSQIPKTIKFDSIFARKKEEIPHSNVRNGNFLRLALVLDKKDQENFLMKSANEIKISKSDYSENNYLFDSRNVTMKSNEKCFTEKVMTISKFKQDNSPRKIRKFDEEEKDYNKEKISNFSQDQNQNKRRNKNSNKSNPENIQYASNFNFTPRINNEVKYFEREKEKSKTHFTKFNKNESQRSAIKGTFFEENKNQLSEPNTTFKQINLYNISQYKNEKMKKFYGELDFNCKKLESIDFKIKSELNKAYKICDVFEKKMNK